MNPFDVRNYLPTSVKEMEALGWDYVDVVLFSGDAYVDHPSFGAAVIGRVLQAAGYRVAIVPQPSKSWKKSPACSSATWAPATATACWM